MKWALTIATAAVLALGGAARGQFQPGYPSINVPQVLNTWYTHYLGRNVDQAGMDFWGPRLAGQNPQDVFAGILASDEYLNRNGGRPDGLVLGLYRDVLGRSPAQLRPQDVEYWVNKMNQYGSRQAMIQEFLRDANTDLFNPPAALPPAAVAPPAAAPVTPAPSPWYAPQYTPPVPAPSPWYAPRYSPTLRYTVPVPGRWRWLPPERHERRERDERHREPYRR
jgi:hypothetical protein